MRGWLLHRVLGHIVRLCWCVGIRFRCLTGNGERTSGHFWPIVPVSLGSLKGRQIGSECAVPFRGPRQIPTHSIKSRHHSPCHATPIGACKHHLQTARGRSKTRTPKGRNTTTHGISNPLRNARSARLGARGVDHCYVAYVLPIFTSENPAGRSRFDRPQLRRE